MYHRAVARGVTFGETARRCPSVKGDVLCIFMPLLANQKLTVLNRRTVYSLINTSNHILKLFRVSSKTKLKKKKNKQTKDLSNGKKVSIQIQQLIA